MHHEQSVIDRFNRFFNEYALSIKKNMSYFSLDGQDAIAGADYLFSDHSRLALIEFKYSNWQLRMETKKDLISRLCELLEVNFQMVALHEQCHFIAWSKGVNHAVNLNVYRNEICNKLFFPRSKVLESAEPDRDSRVRAKLFCEEFFREESTRSLGLEDFEKYVAWYLAEAGDSGASSFELLVDNKYTDECAMIKVPSVRVALEYINNKRKPGQSFTG